MLYVDSAMTHMNTKDCIEKDLLLIARKIVGKRGRRLSWLSFAKRTPLGYAFLKTTDSNWDVWEEIVQQVKKIHPQYEFAVVVEIASAFFNQEEEALNTLELV